MSRLSVSRNPPGAKAYLGKKFKGFRKNQPKYNAPIALHGACRNALNEAIRNKDVDAADHISKKQHRAFYARISKIALIDVLAGILRGERIVR